MTIKVGKPEFDQDFFRAVQHAKGKGATATILNEDSYIYVTVKSQNRKLAVLYFEKHGDKAILTKQHIIEREYNPFELALSVLTSFCKRTKIKYILTESDTIKVEFS